MPDFVCLECSDVAVIPLSTDDFISYGLAWNKKHPNKIIGDLVKVSESIYPPLFTVEK